DPDRFWVYETATAMLSRSGPAAGGDYGLFHGQAAFILMTPIRRLYDHPLAHAVLIRLEQPLSVIPLMFIAKEAESLVSAPTVLNYINVIVLRRRLKVYLSRRHEV